MGKKICVIGVYFGKLPQYFNLWLKSCEFNPNIDFFIFTDNLLTDLPENVKSILTSLDEIKSTASKFLGFEVNLRRPYKTCDFKPIYGFIFKEHIKKYDYWAHCDFDLIFGDILYFFEKYDLYKYDRINALGHLSFYKNTGEVNNRFKCDGSRYNYRTVFTTDKSYAFDEISGMTSIYLQNQFPFFYKLIFVDIASVYDRYRMIEEYPLDEKPINYKHQIFYWENGKCFRIFYDKSGAHKKEYMYIHFKKRPNFIIDFDVNKVTCFLITKYGFIPKKEVEELDIVKYNPYKGILYELFEKNIFIFKATYNKIKNKITAIWR